MGSGPWPSYKSPRAAMPEEVPSLSDLSDLTDDALTGRVRVLQRRRGHRYSLDDVLTAWVAAVARPDARTCLDLGCGLGSVLLMLADTLQAARLAGIEAQAVSHDLLQRNVARNHLAERVQPHFGDLRDATLLTRVLDEVSPCGFDLVTGTPPYKPVGTATASPDSQKAHARLELRGGVEAYLQAAAQMLAPDGLCVVCAEAGAEHRVAAGAAAAGLSWLARLDVIPAQGRKGRLFAVHSLVRATPDEETRPVVISTFVARDQHGARTEQALALRRFFGLHDNPEQTPSPQVRTRKHAASAARASATLD